MTIEERKQRILAKIAEMKAEGADMQNALTILEVKPDEEVEQDMRTIAASMAKLPPGQLKKILTADIIAILAKYGVVIG